MWQDEVLVYCKPPGSGLGCIARVVACLNASALAPSLWEHDTAHYPAKYTGSTGGADLRVVLLEDDAREPVIVLISHETQAVGDVVAEVVDVLRRGGFDVEHDPGSRKWF